MITLPSNFVRPRYDETCFSSLPHSIRYLLTQEKTGPLALGIDKFSPRYDIVITLLIDGFGWRFFEKFNETSSCLKEMVHNGSVSKLTSQFPSTTAAHITTIHTGLEVGQSGVYEWQYYEPQLDDLFACLLYSYAGDGKRETLRGIGSPATLYPQETFYQSLQTHGIASHVLQHREYTPSTYSNTVFQGAEVHPFVSLPSALASLEQLVNQVQEPTYFILYFSHLDSVSHVYGTHTLQVEAEIRSLLMLLDWWFARLASATSLKTLLLLTADHGHTPIDPKSTIYLNQLPGAEQFQHYLQTNRKGKLMVPAGCCRDMHLYVKPDYLEEAEAWLIQNLEEHAEVFRTQNLVEGGFFGKQPISSELQSRLGNLVIVPHAREAVWWHVPKKFEQNHYSAHGGMVDEEMEIPLLLYEV